MCSTRTYFGEDMKNYIFYALAFLCTCSFAYAGDTKVVESGSKAWASFECSTYAAFANKNEDSKELFKVGYQQALVFLDAVESKKITEQDLHSSAPIGILFVMSGPSKEFIAGRIYEAANNHASDEIIKNDASGLPINDASKWNFDKELQTLIANNKYSKGNCGLLKE
jgi:hypothetical protein